MKKNYSFLKTFMLVLIAAVAFNVNAQNIVTNGGLESWTDDDPDFWNKTENITQETTIVHGGTYAAAHESASGTKDFGHGFIPGIIVGEVYNLSYFYYDNDNAARTRLWAYWKDIDGESVGDVIDSEYSTDIDAWQQVNMDVVAPAGAAQFYLEVRVYKQDDLTGGFVYYDDFSFTPGTAIVAAPLISPESGTYYVDELEITISCATAESTIYYTMNGSDPTNASVEYTAPFMIDMDTPIKAIAYVDGLAPSAITTAEYVLSDAEMLFNQDWNSMEWNGWEAISMLGDQNWVISDSYGIDDTPCVKATGFEVEPFPNDNWLVSPGVDLVGVMGPVLSFYTATYYDGMPLEVKYATDFDGQNIGNATWEDLDFTPSAGNWEWTYSGDINVSGIAASNVYFAFRFQSDDQESSTWEIDDILLLGQVAVAEDVIATVNLFPNPTTTSFTLTSIPFESTMQLFDINGRLVSSTTASAGDVTIDVSDFAKGNYMIILTSKEGSDVIRKKVVVQ